MHHGNKDGDIDIERVLGQTHGTGQPSVFYEEEDKETRRVIRKKIDLRLLIVLYLTLPDNSSSLDQEKPCTDHVKIRPGRRHRHPSPQHTPHRQKTSWYTHEQTARQTEAKGS